MKLLRNYAVKKIITILSLTPSLAVAQAYKNNMPYPTTPLNENYSRSGLRPSKSLSVAPGLSMEEIADENSETSDDDERKTGLDVVSDDEEEFSPAYGFGRMEEIPASASFKTPEEFDQEL